MNELLLHVGAHKTGSSSIQITLDAHRERLLNSGVKVYPGKNHTVFYRAFTDVPESFHRYYRSWGKNANQKEHRSRLRNYFLSNRGVDHIVSAEDISLLSEKSLMSLNTFLYKECGISKITVLCFLREPLDYLNSNLQQYIKPGLVTLDEITANTLYSYKLQGHPDFSGGLQNVLSEIYFPIPRKLTNAFGVESVYFKKFETSIVNGLISEILVHFKHCKGVKGIHTLTSNMSMSHEACILLAEFNNRHPLLFDNLDINEQRVTNRIASLIRSVPGKPAKLANYSFLDLQKINYCVDQVNTIVGFKILTPVDKPTAKQNSFRIFDFSNESLKFLDGLIDVSTIDLPNQSNRNACKNLTAINKLLERNHQTRWRSLYTRCQRRYMS